MVNGDLLLLISNNNTTYPHRKKLNLNIMATVYKATVKVVSPWCSFDEETIQKTIEKALEGLLVDNRNKLEDVEVEVERIA